ncbi:alpha-N-arabinofuranosidase [candidate division KSB1 bacterium]|nr:alpha-N-arabinofuranosidase [candidate division KSB1 bacterium]
MHSDPIRLQIDPQRTRHRIPTGIYGQFAEHLGRCIYPGVWVGEKSRIPNDRGIRLDVVEALKQLELPVLRWPGGCFADNYHWMDGIGPAENRPRRHNLWWNQPEDNAFGTDEFIRFCRLIGTEPYLVVNVGSGSVQEAMNWVEYCNSTQDTAFTRLRRENGVDRPHRVRYWGIGNESWGCGGKMQPEYYADLYRRFAAYLRPLTGKSCRLIACGSYPDFPDWDERFLAAMSGALDHVDLLALHIYTGWTGQDVDFDDRGYYQLLADIDIMDRHLRRAGDLAQAFSSETHRIGLALDEWGTWHKQAIVENGLEQQNTLRDALFAAASFHLFHRHADRLEMTNMAQTINVLQALIFTRGDHLVRTPTYHVYELLKKHREAELLEIDLSALPTLDFPDQRQRPVLSVSASRTSDGSIFVSLVNLDLSRTFTVECQVEDGSKAFRSLSLLTADNPRRHNTFESPNAVIPCDLPLPQGNAVQVPPHSLMTLTLAE